MARSKRREAIASITGLLAEADAAGAPLANDGAALLLGDILDRAGLSWNHLRRYDEIRELLGRHASENGLLYSRQGSTAPEEGTDRQEGHQDAQGNLVPAKLLRDARKRLSEAEKRCAELRAENVALRATISRQSSVADLIARGGRISPS